MFDRIELIEPLPCYSCFSTAEDDIGTNKQLSEIELGENKLKVLRIDDGKGGIKVFQTKDLDCLLNNYWFPGFVPSRGKSFYNGMWEIDHENPSPLSLIEICNSCNSVWRGDLYLKYEKENDIFLTDFIEIWPKEGSLLIQQKQETELYHIFFINDKIRITPKIPNAIREYRRRAEESQRKAENYQIFLDSINIEYKKMIKNSLEEILQNIEKRRASSSNELVRAIEDYEIANEKRVYAEGALYASFVILYGKTRDKNVLELVSMSGLTTPEEFLEDFPTYEWFFIEGRDLTEREKTLACFGGYAGDFLIKIKPLD